MGKVILSLFIAVCVLTACKQNCADVDNAQEIMGKWYGQQIRFPENKLLNQQYVPRQNAVDLNKVANDDSFIVIHYFDADCDKCIKNLTTIQDFIKRNKNHNVKYVFIADGPVQQYAEAAVSKLKFEYPVYFEKNFLNYFKINHFPNETTYYTALTKKGRLILFGSLYFNEKAEKLYWSLIDNNCPSLLPIQD